MVAQGYTQIKGIDYNANYSPVVKYICHRLVMAEGLKPPYLLIAGHQPTTPSKSFRNRGCNEFFEGALKVKKGFSRGGHTYFLRSRNPDFPLQMALTSVTLGWCPQIGS